RGRAEGRRRSTSRAMLPVRRAATRAVARRRRAQDDRDSLRRVEKENLARQEKNPCIRFSFFYNSSRKKKTPAKRWHSLHRRTGEPEPRHRVTDRQSTGPRVAGPRPSREGQRSTRVSGLSIRSAK